MECQESLLQYVYIYIIYVHITNKNQAEWWKPVFGGSILGRRPSHGWLVQSLLNPVVGSDLWVQIDKIDQLNWTFLDVILLG